MKDYKTLTREKVDVEPGAARYMGETHMMEDWSDKMIDLVLNGPTLNGFKKDELRAMLRQTYAALKQYEQIGPMASPYMNDPSAIVARAFAELYVRTPRRLRDVQQSMPAQLPAGRLHRLHPAGRKKAGDQDVAEVVPHAPGKPEGGKRP